MLTLTGESFDNAITSTALPVLVDFWAEWCSPCHAIAPSIERLAKAYEGKLVVAKVDMDDNEKLAVRYGVRSLPTLLIFKGGAIVGQLIGAVPYKVIEAEVKKHI